MVEVDLVMEKKQGQYKVNGFCYVLYLLYTLYIYLYSDGLQTQVQYMKMVTLWA